MTDWRGVDCKQGLAYRYQPPLSAAERNYDAYRYANNLIARQALMMEQKDNPYLEMTLGEYIERYKRGNPLWFWTI